jgi:hypothetical protein
MDGSGAHFFHRVVKLSARTAFKSQLELDPLPSSLTCCFQASISL